MSSGRLPLPSDRLRPATSAPFAAASGSASLWKQAYAKSSIPCRVCHGSVHHSLVWKVEPDTLLAADRGCGFAELLVLCAHGLSERDWPHTFIASTAWETLLLGTAGAREAVVKALPQLVPPLRAALASTVDEVVLGALQATRQLAQCCGASLLPYVGPLLVPLSAADWRMPLKGAVRATFSELLSRCGPDALREIRRKLPGFTAG